MPISILFFSKNEEHCMKINKQKVEKFLAFTLAEVLITMIIITLMTLASIPVIKKSKEYRAASKDKNTWMAMYVPQADGSEKLTVFVDGKEDKSGKYLAIDQATGNEYAKFVPPTGVTRFNVTVVGGGGGGAAGEATTGQSKVFTPESTDNTFVPMNDGLYQVVAIGGGGGGGGGGVACNGAGGYSGAAVIANVKLKANEVYTAQAGAGGGGGKPQKPLNFIAGLFVPVLAIASVATAVFTGGASLAVLGVVVSGSAASFGAMAGSIALAVADGNQPNDRLCGGGFGLNSAFHGINADGKELKIVACGGGGGQHRRKKAVLKCKTVGGQEGCGEITCCGKGAVDSVKCEAELIKAAAEIPGFSAKQKTMVEGVEGTALIQDPWKEGKRKEKPNGWICRENPQTKKQECRGSVGSKLPTVLKDLAPSQFGNGGRGGNFRKTGKPGSDGFVQVQEIAVYGGGGGNAGSISFYSYTKSPLDSSEVTNDKCTFDKPGDCVKVFPGKGGERGIENGEAGKDGTFSRFGNRIIADGGAGGRARAVNANDLTSKQGVDDVRAEGEDGVVSAIPSNLQEIIASYYPSGFSVLEETLGGLMHKESINSFDGLGSNVATTIKKLPIPGAGGGGGAAQGTKTLGGLGQFGQGGRGASGIVLVTW